MDLGEFRLARTLQYQAQSERKIEVVRQLLVQEPDFNSYQLFRYLAGSKDFISQADLIAFLHENNFFVTKEDAAALVARYTKQSTMSYQDFFVNLELPNIGNSTASQSGGQRNDSVGYKVLLAHKMRTEVEANRNIAVMKDLLAEELGDNFYRAFRRADSSRSGFLNVGDIRAILGKFSISLTDAELDCLLRRYDSNNDGRISYLDFLTQLMPDGRLESLRTPHGSPQKHSSPYRSSSRLDTSYRSPIRSRASPSKGYRTPDRSLNTSYRSPSRSFRKSRDDPTQALRFEDLNISERGSRSEPRPTYRSNRSLNSSRHLNTSSSRLNTSSSRLNTSSSRLNTSSSRLNTSSSRLNTSTSSRLNTSTSSRLNASLNRSTSRSRLNRSYSKSPRALEVNTNLDVTTEAKHELEAEFEAMRQRLAMHPSFTLLNAFKHLDRHNQGYITISELKRALTDAGHFVTRGELATCVRLFDTNGDGRISYSEFIAKMMPTESVYSELVSSPSAGGIRYERRLSIPAQLDLANALKQRIDQENELNEINVSQMYAWDNA